MECRKFEDSIDSYLCDELLVETNLEMLRHAEHCPKCRAEMMARRSVRLQMQSAGSKQKMSEAGHARLRARLHEEAARTKHSVFGINWLASWFKRPMAGRLVMATVSGLVCLLFLTWFFTRKSIPQVAAATLSPAVLKQAVEEHELCSHYYATSPEPAGMSKAAVDYDAAYASLDRIAKVRAAGMQLHAAHKCSLVGRSFGHLLFSRGTDLISVLVTERDAAALQNGQVPNDDGRAAGLQQAGQAGCTIDAYQSARHVVLLVSKLPAAQNQKLAEDIAAPISEHLRQFTAAK